MVTKVRMWASVKTRTRERTHSLSEGIGLLRSLVIGGTIFSLLSIPLLLNIQTTKYSSEITSLTVRMRMMQNKMIDKESQIDSILETDFPSATVVKNNGQTFFIRKGK